MGARGYWQCRAGRGRTVAARPACERPARAAVARRVGGRPRGAQAASGAAREVRALPRLGREPVEVVAERLAALRGGAVALGAQRLLDHRRRACRCPSRRCRACTTRRASSAASLSSRSSSLRTVSGLRAASSTASRLSVLARHAGRVRGGDHLPHGVAHVRLVGHASRRPRRRRASRRLGGSGRPAAGMSGISGALTAARLPSAASPAPAAAGALVCAAGASSAAVSGAPGRVGRGRVRERLAEDGAGAGQPGLVHASAASGWCARRGRACRRG